MFCSSILLQWPIWMVVSFNYCNIKKKDDLGKCVQPLSELQVNLDFTVCKSTLFLTPHRVLFQHPQRSVKTMLNFPGVCNFAFYPICWLYVQTEHKLAQGMGEKTPTFHLWFSIFSAVFKYIYYTVTLRLCQQRRAVHPQVFAYCGKLACYLAQRRYLFMCCTCLMSLLPYT
jgi:hypothetical protein